MDEIRFTDLPGLNVVKVVNYEEWKDRTGRSWNSYTLEITRSLSVPVGQRFKHFGGWDKEKLTVGAFYLAITVDKPTPMGRVAKVVRFSEVHCG